MLVYGLIILYGSVKFSTMILREDTNFQTETKRYALDPEQNYTAEDLELDFFLTVVETNWNRTGEHNYVYHATEELQKYITLTFNQETFSLKHNVVPEELDLVDCTDELLSPFEGALHQGSTQMKIDKIKPLKPICVRDKKKMKFSGTWDYYTNQILRPKLEVKKCKGDNCATQDEIDAFLRNKYLKLTILSDSYDTTNYDIEQKVKKIA